MASPRMSKLLNEGSKSPKVGANQYTLHKDIANPNNNKMKGL